MNTISIQRREVVRANRKYLQPRSRCKRWEMPQGRPWTNFPPGIKAQIQRLYPGVEVLWHPVRQTWEVYSVVGHGASSGGDKMVHEFTLKSPPGTWLLRHMQKYDIINRPVDPIGMLEQAEERHDQQVEKEFTHMREELIKDALMLKHERHSIVIPKNTKEVLA